MVEREQLIAMVKGMQAGDEAATAQMYETFHEDFYYFILKTVNNDRELAEDLTQDTFVKILETIHELEEPVAFVTWAKQIAYHKCTGYFRKKKELLLDENEDGTSAFDIQVEENAEFIPDEALDNKELKQTIMNMINELPEEQRAALLLRYFNEVSVKEIAQIQDVSEGTVKSRLNYARKSIKQAVETYEKKNGVKLHCVGVLPLLLWLFREYRVANELSMAAGTATQTFVLAEETAAVAGMVASGGAAAGAATTTAATTATAATTTAATTATTTAAAVATKSAVAVGIKAAATALSTKIVAGVVAAAVVVGGTAAGITVAKKNNAPQPAPEAAIVQTIEETESAEEVMAEEAVLEETVIEETAAEETTAATEAATEAAEEATATTEPTEETNPCSHDSRHDIIEENFYVVVCDQCGEQLVKQCIEECVVSNYEFDEATCWLTGTCDRCGTYYAEYAHNMNGNVCTQCGYTEETVCDHEFGYGDYDTQPGWVIITCTKCGYQETWCDHDYAYDYDTEDGWVTATCTRCGDQYKECTAHEFGEEYYNEEMCTWSLICTKCGHVSHSVEHRYSDGVCVQCGAACSHSYEEYTTTGEDGVEYLVSECYYCGVATYTPVA